jgi:heme exporter protein CcmD
MSAYFAMDGYAAFVWPAYALTFVGVGGLIGLAIKRRRDAEARLKRLEAEEGEA